MSHAHLHEWNHRHLDFYQHLVQSYNNENHNAHHVTGVFPAQSDNILESFLMSQRHCPGAGPMRSHENPEMWIPVILNVPHCMWVFFWFWFYFPYVFFIWILLIVFFCFIGKCSHLILYVHVSYVLGMFWVNQCQLTLSLGKSIVFSAVHYSYLLTWIIGICLSMVYRSLKFGSVCICFFF